MPPSHQSTRCSLIISTMLAPIHLIYACAKNGAIGLNNQLPWHLPEDLAHFKKLTTGQTVLMGRKTWDSLPSAFKPLPNRLNLVMTRNSDWHAPGALAVSSLEMAQELHHQHCSQHPQDKLSSTPAIWVIGGAQVYAQTLSKAQSVEMTEIDLEVNADAFAPLLGQEWREIHREEHTSSKGVSFRFLTFNRF
jgi:dihydrofolate reductase